MKGGGDAASAARAVLQTGEYDYAWNMQVEDDILQRLEQGGKGRVEIWPTGAPEHIQLNQTDPAKEVDGERSSVKTTHPFLTDSAVRQALNLRGPGGSGVDLRSPGHAGPSSTCVPLLPQHAGVQRERGQPVSTREGSAAPTASARRRLRLGQSSDLDQCPARNASDRQAGRRGGIEIEKSATARSSSSIRQPGHHRS
jgi:hypothetical protein